MTNGDRSLPKRRRTAAGRQNHSERGDGDKPAVNKVPYFSRAAFEEVLSAGPCEIPWRNKRHLWGRLAWAVEVFHAERSFQNAPATSVIVGDLAHIEQTSRRLLTALGTPNGEISRRLAYAYEHQRVHLVRKVSNFENVVTEADRITYTAMLSSAAQGAVTVKLSNGETIDIEDGQSSGSVTIGIQGDETSTKVTISDVSGGKFSAAGRPSLPPIIWEVRDDDENSDGTRDRQVFDYQGTSWLLQIVEGIQQLRTIADAAHETVRGKVTDGHDRHKADIALHHFVNRLAEHYSAAFGQKATHTLAADDTARDGSFVQFLGICLATIGEPRSPTTIRELVRRAEHTPELSI